jgi:hypothetical protein
MQPLRHRRLQGPIALALAALFFASQAFSCCYANQRIGRALASVFAVAAAKPAAAPSAHSCCPRPENAPAQAGHSGCAKGGCCIQDANQRVPQLASAPVSVPDLSGLAVAWLPAPALEPVSAAFVPQGKTGSGPPLYLRTLRLLV